MPSRRLLAIAALLWGTAAHAQVEETATQALPPAGEQPHLLRALLETSAAVGVATYWYWKNQTFNSRDWDLKWDGPSWKGKLDLHFVRFDRNDFWTNAGSHPRSGAIVHEIARSNGFGLPGALLLNASSSVLWEFVVEYREMPSINDMIANPLGGLPIGEVFFQLGQYFRRSAPNPFNVTVATVLTPFVTAHDLIDGRRRAYDAVDDLGLSREVWHRFTLGGGFGPASYGDVTKREAQVVLRTELVNVPGYGAPVNASSRPGLGALTGLELQLAFDQRELTIGRFTAETLIAGLFHQRGQRGRGGLGWLVGLASAFEFSVHRYPGLREDLIGDVGIVGPLVEASAFLGGVRLRARAQAYGDFAMVRPHAYDDFLESTSNFRGIKSSIEWYGYYYALGPTVAARLSAEQGVVDGGADLRWDRFFSLQGRDRFQEQLTDDFALRDGRVRLRGWLGARVPTTRVRAAVEAELLQRSGSIPARGLERVTTERRALGTMTLVF